MADLRKRLESELADRYALERELGSGGMATVYLARDLRHGRRVAIKVLKPEIAALSGPDRFLREIRLTAGLTHPHILPLLDSGQAGGLPYFVTPYVEGESLAQRLEREGQLPVDEAVRITLEVADALGMAHRRRIVHRDIKPANILLEEGHAVVADFGIGLALSGAGEPLKTTVGVSLGTPGYMSPEQAMGTAALDGRCDLYALGCVLYEMLTGERAFRGRNLEEIVAKQQSGSITPVSVLRDNVPAAVDRTIQQVLSRLPADRFQNASDFVRALGRTPRPPDLILTIARAAGVVAAVAGLGLAVWFLIPGRGPAAPTPAVARDWMNWESVAGEDLVVAAVTGPTLVVHAAHADSVYLFEDRRWRALAVPDSFELRRWAGQLPDGRLPALKVRWSAGERQTQLWWLEVSPNGLEPEEALTAFEPTAAMPYIWTDGREVVAWGPQGLERLVDGRFAAQFVGRMGLIKSHWGIDDSHRYAIVQMREDTLFGVDNSGVRPMDILPDREPQERPEYIGGATFPDRTTVVLGALCSPAGGCRPLVLQQDTLGVEWRRVPFEPESRLPQENQDPESPVGRHQFHLLGVGGRNRGDYYVWGDWTVSSTRYGCPPGQPCIWHVNEGRAEPVEELSGKAIANVVSAAGNVYAFTQDGAVWLRGSGSWTHHGHVPGFSNRLIAATPSVTIRAYGGQIGYHSAGETGFTIFRPSPRGVSAAVPPLQLAIAGNTAAMLTAGGTVSVSECGKLGCSPWEPIDLPVQQGQLHAIHVLKTGEIIAAGHPGMIVSWHEDAARREPVPPEARDDTLWAVQTSGSGTVLVMGRRTLLRREAPGVWTIDRRFQPGSIAGQHFAVLSDGDVVVGGQDVWLYRQWTSEPLRLYSGVLGYPTVSAVHALEDGRLVVGFANLDSPGAAGFLQVWEPPARKNHSVQVSLPLSVDVSDLADDGERLLVVGRGGSMAIPLEALPFGAGPQRR